MILDRPFIIILYYNGNIEYDNDFINCDLSTLFTSNIFGHKIQHEEFKYFVYASVGIEQMAYTLNISQCYYFNWQSNI